MPTGERSWHQAQCKLVRTCLRVKVYLTTVECVCCKTWVFWISVSFGTCVHVCMCMCVYVCVFWLVRPQTSAHSTQPLSVDCRENNMSHSCWSSQLLKGRIGRTVVQQGWGGGGGGRSIQRLQLPLLSAGSCPVQLQPCTEPLGGGSWPHDCNSFSKWS